MRIGSLIIATSFALAAAQACGSDAPRNPCDDADVDGDGSKAQWCGGDDCDDDDRRRYPGATEVCDPEDVDEDCDPTTFGERDADRDGAFDARCCNQGNCGDDCDDNRASTNPDVPETCDSVDNDCDGSVDEDELSSLALHCAEALAQDGFDARITGLLGKLPTDELRLVSLRGAAFVLLSNDELSLDEDGELFVSLALSLGLSREQAIDAIEEARDHFE